MANVISQEDMAYLAGQSQNEINKMLSGMTALMRDTDSKVSKMESQGWFKRMINSVTGKNKATAEEIRQNHDKLNAYMAEAVGKLFERDLIDEKIIMSLGENINMLYADHVQLKQQLGAFVDKLNRKIESVDNYNMLIQEIDLGDYSDGVSPIVAVCEITSFYDDRILKDDRKLDILHKKLAKQNILNDEEINIVDCLNDMVNIPESKVGQVAMALGAIYDRNPFAALMLDMIENYHYLPVMTRKMKSKSALVKNTITANELDDSFAISSQDVYDSFVEAKSELANSIVATVCEESTEEAEEIDNNIDKDSLNKMLFIDVCADDADEIKSLLELGADPNAVDEENRPVLCVAVCLEHIDIVRLLLDAGADPDSLISDTCILSVAIMFNYYDSVQLLIDAGADVNYRYKGGHSPLEYAETEGDETIIKMLIDAGAY